MTRRTWIGPSRRAVVDRPPPSLSDLFTGFLVTGLCGFGGVLPWARRLVVERRGWLTAAEFTDLLGLCQFLPGPNVINLSVALGARFHGLAGSLAAFSGLMAAPLAIVIALGLAYDRLAAIPTVAHAFLGLSAGASALVVATALRIAAPLCNRVSAVVALVATFIAVAVLRWPLGPVILVAAPLSALFSWWEARAGAGSVR